jgi:hypothetical protein
MKHTLLLIVAICCITAAVWADCPDKPGVPSRTLPVSVYLDKMKGGWIGQMAGVGWGDVTEFKYMGRVVPEAEMPKWKPGLVNQYHQDDLYVEMTFVRSMELYGWDVSMRQAGIDFANSGYPLWHANKFGRKNLRAGIAPPDCSHPQFSAHADDIDYQIESDFSGLLSPALPTLAMELGEKFGRLMNYGDGLYAGQFMGAMYSEAFFETDMEKIVQAGLRCIPAESQYHECIMDVLRWHRENPGDWQKCWNLVNEKYYKNPEYRKFSCDKGAFDIDAKLNGAYVVLGLLYGDRDPEKTIIIATRCGMDSDCNPSNAGGVLFTTIGFAKLPEQFKSALKTDVEFDHTAYTFDKLIAVCDKLARQGVERAGGCVRKNDKAGETFVIPVLEPKPGAAVSCWAPGPIAGSKFTPEEMAKITEKEKDEK